jgi:dynein heavy chain
LKSAIEGVVIKWATQINDVLIQESSQAFDGGQNPTPNAGKFKKNVFVH